MTLGPRGKVHASLTGEEEEEKKEEKKEGEDADKEKPKAKPKDKGAPEGYCVARIDLDEVRKFREQFQTLQARQPSVYRAVVRRH